MTETQSVEHALRLRAVEGRMTVAEKAATIAALLRFARQIDTYDEQTGSPSPDLCAWQEPVIQLADACREVAVQLGRATGELAAVRASARQCLTASSACQDACRHHKDARASCAQRAETARRIEQTCVELLALI